MYRINLRRGLGDWDQGPHHRGRVGERRIAEKSRGGYSMATLFATVTESPPKGGTWSAWKRAAMQAPTAVPAKPPWIAAEVTRPLFPKVTATRPSPVGPPALLQARAASAADESASLAAAPS